jgi:putative heme transporter
MDAPTPSADGQEPGPQGAPARHRRWPRVVAATVGGGAIAAVLIIDRHMLAESLASLSRLNVAWFTLAVACELVSLAAFGLSRRRLLRAEGHQAPLGSVMAITYAGNALSMSIPFAGAQLAAVFAYRQFRRRGLDPALTGWALTVSAIASSSALALVLVTGAFVGGAGIATAAGFLGAAIFALPAVAVILALRFPRVRSLANRVLAQVASLARRLLRKPGVDPAALEDFLERLAAIRLGPARYGEVFGLAVVNWLGDCACLACAVLATGGHVPWQGLLLAYGAGAVVGSTGVTPGGFAVVEVTLTAALVAAGMDSSHALSAVLAYRLVNFWMILVGGGVAMVFLTRKREQQIRRYARPGDEQGRRPGDEQGTVPGDQPAGPVESRPGPRQAP